MGGEGLKSKQEINAEAQALCAFVKRLVKVKSKNVPKVPLETLVAWTDRTRSRCSLSETTVKVTRLESANLSLT